MSEVCTGEADPGHKGVYCEVPSVPGMTLLLTFCTSLSSVRVSERWAAEDSKAPEQLLACILGVWTRGL